MSSRAARFFIAVAVVVTLIAPVAGNAIAVQLTPAPPRIALGTFNACAIATGGVVKCWGMNDQGQLGTGNNTESSIPTTVVGLSSGARAIAVGHDDFSCVLTSAGGVKCWGNNRFGQLGDGTTRSSTRPVDAAGLASGIIAISLGTQHGCALTAAGGVKCWGFNGHGELGRGVNSRIESPGDVPGFTSGVAAVEAGGDFTCVLTTAGGVKCWGDNHSGQLGNGGLPLVSFAPVDVVGLASGVRAIDAYGQHVCAVTTSGAAKCWGANPYGAIGNGSGVAEVRTPTDVIGLSAGVTAIATGSSHSCAVVTGGAVTCWGDNNATALGVESVRYTTSPVAMPALTGGVSDVVLGLHFGCAVSSAGRISCWGDDRRGKLGNGTNDRSVGGPEGCPPTAWCTTPVDVLGLGVAKPDARIRLGSGSFAGNNVYNGTGAGQSKTGSAARAKTISFTISAENDGSGPDDLTIRATGSSASAFVVKYFRGATDITASVLSGTYHTGSLAPGASVLITAKVTIKSSAPARASVTRLVTITSSTAATKDAVKLIAKRA